MNSSAVRRWLPVFIALLAGASVGFGSVRIQERGRTVGGPAGWVRTLPNIPVLLARLAGPPNAPEDGWPLGSYGALLVPGDRIQAVEVEATLPETGQLKLVLEGTGAQKGVALQLDRGRSPFSLVTTSEKVTIDAAHKLTDWEPLQCDRSLPAPTEGRVRVRLESDAGKVLAGVAVGDAAMVTAVCVWGKPTIGASVRAGLRRIGVRSISVTQPSRPPLTVVAPTPSLAMRGIATLVGALVLGLLAAGLRLWERVGVRGGAIALPCLPLLAVGPLSGTDIVAGLQALRLVPDRPLWMALAIPLVCAGILASGLLMGRLSRRGTVLTRPWQVGLGALLGLTAIPGYGPVGGLLAVPGAALGAVWGRVQASWGVSGGGPLPAMALGAVFGALVTALLAPQHGMAVSYSALVGLGFGAVVWLNVCRPRGFNILSLFMVGLMVFMADQGLRWTETGARLTGRSSRARDSGGTDATRQVSGTFSSFEALEHTQAWSEYPLQDYPVEPAPRRSGATRLVALGGSSTGGAWQNDSLDQFWPAELERQHGPSVQSVNQGVGGWTTLHIRRFLETRLDDVDPDVVVLYIGHNDVMTESIRPYGALYAAWQQGNDVSITVSGALSNVPLYQLARFGLQSALGGSVAAAVPIADARSNLTQIAALLDARNVPMMVVREGVVPDPSVLDGYGDMLSSWAADTENAVFVDAAAQLTGPGAGDVFLDDCHLTDRGHARVAAAVRTRLLDEGWLPPSN